MTLVDISSKEPICRYSCARGSIELPESIVRRLLSRECVGAGDPVLISRIVGFQAVKCAWMYIPLLHTIDIAHADVRIGINDGRVECIVCAKTVAKTGVEMDVLFGALAALIALIDAVRSDVKDLKSIEIKSISVITKIRGCNDVQTIEVNEIRGSCGDLRCEDLSEVEVKAHEAVSHGKIVLREITIDRILRGDVEKGDPIDIAKVSAVSAVKSLWKLVPTRRLSNVTHVKVSTKISKREIQVETTVKSYSRQDCALESLFGTGTALLTIWDVVKKYEKDERGQYPHTRVESIRLVDCRSL